MLEPLPWWLRAVFQASSPSFTSYPALETEDRLNPGWVCADEQEIEVDNLRLSNYFRFRRYHDGCSHITKALCQLYLWFVCSVCPSHNVVFFFYVQDTKTSKKNPSNSNSPAIVKNQTENNKKLGQGCSKCFHCKHV